MKEEVVKPDKREFYLKRDNPRKYPEQNFTNIFSHGRHEKFMKRKLENFVEKQTLFFLFFFSVFFRAFRG